MINSSQLLQLSKCRLFLLSFKCSKLNILWVNLIIISIGRSVGVMPHYSEYNLLIQNRSVAGVDIHILSLNWNFLNCDELPIRSFWGFRLKPISLIELQRARIATRFVVWVETIYYSSIIWRLYCRLIIMNYKKIMVTSAFQHVVALYLLIY